MKKSTLAFVRFSCLIAAFAALPSVCRALPYFGTFTQTITASNVPGVYVGVQYHGYYTYESETMDGTFATNWWPVNQTLNGYIFVPFAKELPLPDVPPWLDGIDAYWSSLKNTSQAGLITIENGEVTDFHWSHEVGGFYMSAGLSSFSAISFYDYWYQNYDDMPSVSGTMEFTGGPRVPDSGSLPSLLVLGFLALGLVRRKISA